MRNENKKLYDNFKNIILNEHYKNTDNICRLGETITFKIFENNINSLNIHNLDLNKLKIETDWFLSGETNIKLLKENNINTWDKKSKNNDIGKSYGYHLKHYGHSDGINQIDNIVNKIKTNPDSRTLIINIWHPEFLGLYPPCIYSYQIRILENKINLIVIQRSCDVINVLPINLIMSGYILSYFANKTGYNMDKIIFQIGDAHIYNKDITI
jgi:thymidylate synthase